MFIVPLFTWIDIDMTASNRKHDEHFTVKKNVWESIRQLIMSYKFITFFLFDHSFCNFEVKKNNEIQLLEWPFAVGIFSIFDNFFSHFFMFQLKLAQEETCSLVLLVSV